MTTLILVFSLLSAVCLSLAVPVEKTRGRKTRDLSFEDFYRPVFPVQTMPSFPFLMNMDQFRGLQLTPYRFPSIVRPYPPGFYSYSYPYPHPHPHPHLFHFRPPVAVQPPIIVLERVPPTAIPTARPQVTVIPIG
ncbi:uncharacterized protein LOC125267269 [Megalobrama amblycephala]|uniref:uncharacterized protein LOC125267269 n=1 Tax=Megalobrama amblycephala TaxID=75352 RepID=UPI00201427DE|nr:uncharacterized protein LOC125267269 [Megalobrama amblycephala]